MSDKCDWSEDPTAPPVELTLDASRPPAGNIVAETVRLIDEDQAALAEFLTAIKVEEHNKNDLLGVLTLTGDSLSAARADFRKRVQQELEKRHGAQEAFWLMEGV